MRTVFVNFCLTYIIERKSHDPRIFVESGLQEQPHLHSFDDDNRSLCIYGDAAYPAVRHVQGPFKGANLTEAQKAFNTSMSGVRIAVSGHLEEQAHFLHLWTSKRT